MEEWPYNRGDLYWENLVVFYYWVQLKSGLIFDMSGLIIEVASIERRKFSSILPSECIRNLMRRGGLWWE
jgi:hypothetical protein